MSYTCGEVCQRIDEYAPPHLALEGDPIGLHLGSYDQKVSRLFMALELTPQAAREAFAFQPDMVFVHHTPFFKPFKQLREDYGHDRIVLELIRRGIALYTAHTNLDCVKNGVNDVLAELLGIENTKILQPLNQNINYAGLGRIGALKQPMTLVEFAAFTAQKLGTSQVRYCGEREKQISTVACCGGAGAFLMTEAKAKGADVYVTSDISHHEGVHAIELGLGLVDGGHFATENPVISVVAAYLKEQMPDLTVAVSSVSGNPFQTL
ncbi:MAG: Nif3-like dinuclear metal center hexameric protein [Clostridiales bacterium]